MVSSHSKRWE